MHSMQPDLAQRKAMSVQPQLGNKNILRTHPFITFALIKTGVSKICPAGHIQPVRPYHSAPGAVSRPGVHRIHPTRRVWDMRCTCTTLQPVQDACCMGCLLQLVRSQLLHVQCGSRTGYSGYCMWPHTDVVCSVVGFDKQGKAFA